MVGDIKICTFHKIYNHGLIKRILVDDTHCIDHPWRIIYGQPGDDRSDRTIGKIPQHKNAGIEFQDTNAGSDL